MNRDIKHTSLQNFVFNCRKSILERPTNADFAPFFYQVEYYYNDYGNRGFIDIYIETNSHIFAIEIKPNLEDLGESIRQALQPLNYLKKKGKPSVVSEIICLYNEANLEILKLHRDMLSTLPKNIRFGFANPNLPSSYRNPIYIYPQYSTKEDIDSFKKCPEMIK